MNRRLLPLALLLLLLSASPAVAAEPTLGGRLSPAQLVYEKGHEVTLRNMSTVPVTVTFTVEGAGWSLEDQSAHPLAVDETVTVPMVSAGQEQATIRAYITPQTAPAGSDATTLVLEASARHLSPWEQIPAVLWLFLALFAFVASWAVLWRLRRRVRVD